MGGKNSQGFNLFIQLTVKAFLAIRPHVTQLVNAVSLMLGADFPSFKGEPTIKRLQDRFVPHMTERQAAEWMMGVIKNAHENVRSTVYDEFQRVSYPAPLNQNLFLKPSFASSKMVYFLPILLFAISPLPRHSRDSLRINHAESIISSGWMC